MKKIRNYSLSAVIILLFISSFINAQHNDIILNKQWNAYWICVPDEPSTDYGVYFFRKDINLLAILDTFIIHVSADNRYKLFVNEKLVSLGPARGDIYNWNYETIDIAKYLVPGKNVIAALVWNEANFRPEAQITYRTGFILQGNSQSEEVLNTNSSWKCIRDKSHNPLAVMNVPGYYVAGAGEYINMYDEIGDWNSINCKDSLWKNAQQITPGLPKGVFSYAYGWMLVPSNIPQMELKYQRLLKLRKAEGISNVGKFPEEKSDVVIPPNSKCTLLLDQTYLTNAYPTLIFSGGDSAKIKISYAEAMFNGLAKGNRNDIEGKTFLGRSDEIISNGKESQTFTSLWWRTYRYIELTIETKNTPLTINDFYGTINGYPFRQNSTFASDEPELNKILEIGWRTARLCANETYMDCPYYEQLQYVGDSRIEALVSLFNSGDDRLMRNAITLINNSRMAEGITLSRYPSYTPQQIPTFSLWWIGMLYDYYRYRPDENFIKDKLQGERDILSFFHKYQQEDGSLKNLPYWIFTDWVKNTKGWHDGMAPVGKNGESSILDMQLMWTYHIAAILENDLGMKEYAEKYRRLEKQLSRTIQKKYWDDSKKMYSDTEEKIYFSQHANTLAILSGLVSGNKSKMLAEKVLKDTMLAQASIYFKFYVHQAFTKAGLGNDYIKCLGIWKKNIEMGMTTWAEVSDIDSTRSDCHAWGSSPNIELYRTVLGIDSDAPGFAKVKIEPHLGTIKKASGEIPHPDGKISVSYAQIKNKWEIEINLPKNVEGRFIWRGKELKLHGMQNLFRL